MTDVHNRAIFLCLMGLFLVVLLTRIIAVAGIVPLTVTVGGTSAQPVSPGTSMPIDITLTNRHLVPLAVDGLSVTIARISAPHADNTHPCSVGDFTIAPDSDIGVIRLAPHVTRSFSDLGISPALWPHVAMVNEPANQDGCKGATLTLRYTATGTLKL